MDLKIEQPLKVQGYDIDVMGIVNNVVYLRWFEDLRMAFLDNMMPFSEMIAKGYSPVLVKTCIKYYKPLTIHDQPKGILTLTRLTRIRWSITIDIKTGETVHCHGEQQGAFFHLKNHKIAKIPQEFMERTQH
ncbi:MAG: thioesterase family protein [candidate division KSB1 bacterium]|nr:thioesterase family protein [candidate division KSB1 bacterium]